MCVPARWSSGISAHQNVECGSAQCTLGNGAFVRGYKLCMVVVAYVWYIETSLVVRLLKTYLHILPTHNKGGQLISSKLNKNWHKWRDGIDDP